MMIFKILHKIFVIMAFILSHIMFAVVAYNYKSVECGIQHQGFSAPINIAFFTAIPFGVGIMVCIILSTIIKRKILLTN